MVILSIIIVAIVAIVAYLLGSINSSILVGKLFGVEDIREHGSGNAGATNTLRTIGKKAAGLAFAGDILKGVIAVLIAWLVDYLTGGNKPILGYIAAVAVVIGHNYPLYFGFKGGKGIATSIATIMVLDWRLGLIILAIAVSLMFITRYVSLGSVMGAICYPIAVAIFRPTDMKYLIFALIIAALAILRHKANIVRLLKGEESKIGKKKPS